MTDCYLTLFLPELSHLLHAIMGAIRSQIMHMLVGQVPINPNLSTYRAMRVTGWRVLAA
jgi:hypothetical protein